MDNRYLRASSPTRRYNTNRNSTGATVDIHPMYDAYGNPRSREAPAPRTTERVVPRPPTAPRIYRDHVPFSRRPEDYDIRRLEPVRRPVSVQPAPSSTSYRPPVSDRSPQQYSKPWTREDESYYLQPASSRKDTHSRNISLDTGRKADSYLVPSRSDRQRPERNVYKSTAIGGSRALYHDIPQIRPPRDKDDKDFGYEYTDFKEQAYRDLAPQPQSRPRPRRTSDLAARERPHSITGIEDTYRSGQGQREGYSRNQGPPVSTRGFSKIDPNGTVRHEYRYPREPESTRSGDESDPPRHRPRKPTVAVHQERPDGYTSNTEERNRDNGRVRSGSIDRYSRPRAESIERSARPRGESIDRGSRRRGESFDRGNDDRSRTINETDDSRRKEPRERRLDVSQSESDDRRHRHHHHRTQRDPSQDRFKPEQPSRLREENERDYKEPKVRDIREPKARDDREPRPRDDREPKQRDRDDEYEKRRDDGGKKEKPEKNDSHYGTGAALGAAGAAAAGFLGAKHHYSKEKEKDKAGSEVSTDRGQRDTKTVPAKEPEENSSRGSEENSDAERERRERRRRRREEKEARARQDTVNSAAGDRLAPPPPSDGTRSISRDRGGQYPTERAASDDERSHRRHRRRKSERQHASSSDTENEQDQHRQVRVVSPAKQLLPKPKGILRRPRERFPEDPAPVREGVAPLKDAGKKGIPPNARWTKIDRRLVNPEALELGNERFEERLDYVIVLRVLSKEEIEQYAQKTVDIREERENREARNQDGARPRREADMGNQEDTEEEYDAPKAIEAQPHNKETLPLPNQNQTRDRMEPYLQPALAPNVAQGQGNMAASMPSLPPPDSLDKDGTRPELYPSNSYHRMAPPSSTASSSQSTAYPPSAPSQPQSQEAPFSLGYASQQPVMGVTGEYNAQGYPVVPPLSQPPYPTSSYPSSQASVSQTGSQNVAMPWPQGPPQGDVPPESEHTQMPVPNTMRP